jgi:glyoxylase-like metal-dependent hydrolase (beta-lactamase superfamily II)
LVRIPILFVNAYFLAEGDSWILVDTGLANLTWIVRQAAVQHFGESSRPEAIVLTHGHFDHAGSALDLAKEWECPIYAHPLELPFLQGKSDYPPQDPTVGGAMAMMSRAMPHQGYDFGDRVRELPLDGSVPGLAGWEWIFTPGHTPGHVSLFRPSDRTLVAGDALATMDLDSWSSQLTREPEISRPPTPFTPDWESAHRSVGKLAALRPRRLLAGHGQCIEGDDLPDRLKTFAEGFEPPEHGRYVPRPALTDKEGVLSVPPPVSDPFLVRVAAVGILALVAYAFWRGESKEP